MCCEEDKEKDSPLINHTKLTIICVGQIVSIVILLTSSSSTIHLMMDNNKKMASWIFQNLLAAAPSDDDESNHNSLVSSPSTQSNPSPSTIVLDQKLVEKSETPKRVINLSVMDAIHRIETASLHDDRIEAMETLTELSTRDYDEKNHREFKEIFPKLFNQINKNESETTTRQYIAIICNLAQLENYGHIYLDLIINGSYTSVVLSLLNENDSYTRYHSTQLLSLLLRHNCQVVQETILSQASIPLILSLLNDFGVLRNEGITFLRKLVESINASTTENIVGVELKKVIVFEGVFERLFGIILQEGGNQGGVIVLDCLFIIYNLLWNNELNRKQFLALQNGGMSYLYPLLVIPDFVKKKKQENVEPENKNDGFGFFKSVLSAGAGVAKGLVATGGSDTLSSYLTSDEHSFSAPQVTSSDDEKETSKQIANSEKQLEIISRVLDIVLELIKSTKEPVKEIMCNRFSGKGSTMQTNNATSSIMIPIMKLALDYSFSSVLTTSTEKNISQLIRTIMYDINMKALFILGHLMFNNRPAQEILESYSFQYGSSLQTLPQQNQLLMLNGADNKLATGSSGNGVVHSLMYDESAIIRLCKIVLYDSDEYRRQLAFSTLKRFLYNNKEGQLIIASTVKAPTLISSSSEESMLCGIILSNAIFSLDKPKHHILESVHAVSVLSTIIRQNSKCKDILLEILYDVQTGRQPKPFFTCLVNTTIFAIKTRVQDFYVISLLRLLCEWMNGSSQTARKFMEQSYTTLMFVSTNQSLILTQLVH